MTAMALRDRHRLAWLTACAWLGLAAFDMALVFGFRRVHDFVRRCGVRTDARALRCNADDIVWAVDEACVWYVKPAACLQRSVVATWLLRRHGIAADLVIGYRTLPFESHAWVEVDERIVNDRPQYRKFFSVLERL